MGFLPKCIGLLGLLGAFSACNRQPLATFQRMPQEVFEREKKTEIAVQNTEKKSFEISPLRKKEVLTASLNGVEWNNGFEAVPMVQKPKGELKQAKKSVKKAFFQEKKAMTQLLTSSSKTTDAKKTMGFWDELNEKLKIGATLLGISIVFALLGIKLIATIFAIGAIFFIVKGLKRIY